MVPRQIRETFSPVFPSRVVSMTSSECAGGKFRANSDGFAAILCPALSSELRRQRDRRSNAIFGGICDNRGVRDTGTGPIDSNAWRLYSLEPRYLADTASMSIKGKAYVMGAFEHPTREAPDKSTPQLHAECMRGVLADAGLSKDDIDGYFCAGDAPGFGAMSMADYLGLRNLRHMDSTQTGRSSS